MDVSLRGAEMCVHEFPWYVKEAEKCCLPSGSYQNLSEIKDPFVKLIARH